MPYSDIIAAKKELAFMADGLEYFKNPARKSARVQLINCFIRLVNAAEIVYDAGKTYEVIDALILQEFATVYGIRAAHSNACQMKMIGVIRNDIGLFLSFGAKEAFDQLAFELAIGFLSDQPEIPAKRKLTRIDRDPVMMLLVNDTKEKFKPAIITAVRDIASKYKLLPYADLNQAKLYREELVQEYEKLPADKRGNKLRTINVLTTLINTVESDHKKSKLADCVCCLILHQMLCWYEVQTGALSLEALVHKVTFKAVQDLDQLMSEAGEVIAKDVFSYAERINVDGRTEPLVDGEFKTRHYNDCKRHYTAQMPKVLAYLQDSYGLWKS